ncbi:hypothetical protein KFD70_28975, partial [Bacillus pfraonensis]|uniref:hypothetical protein n=1 Tax=Bacillus pfraonensis TaxID=2830844 RepID=UPI003D6DCE62
SMPLSNDFCTRTVTTLIRKNWQINYMRIATVEYMGKGMRKWIYWFHLFWSLLKETFVIKNST